MTAPTRREPSTVKSSRYDLATWPGMMQLSGLLITVGMWYIFRDRAQLGAGPEDYMLLTGVTVTSTMTIVLAIQRRSGRLNRSHVRSLEHKAVHDELTGLPSRTELVRRLEGALSDAYRRDVVVGVLFLDLDGFKAVNDTIGHAAGDELLRQFALRLSASVRSCDLVARVGGDEFVVVTVGQQHEGSVRTVAEHIRRIFEAPIALTDGDIHMTPSIGVALASRAHPALPEELITQADQAMYRAKRGRSGVAVFDEDQRREVGDRRMVKRELLPALASGQFQVYYQPIVSYSQDTTVGFEGLIRWRHPTLGTIGPERFLAAAEEAGLIGRLGEVVLREVAAQASLWNYLANDGSNLSVAVNLSERQLVDPSFPEQVAAIVEWAGIAPTQLDMEIGEDLLQRRVNDNIQVIRRLSEMGCRIVVHDFGINKSSTSRIESLGGIDVVKIHRTITSSMHHDESARLAIEAAVSLAGSTGIQVVAQGVETDQQRLKIAELGIDQMQGFLFLEPSPPDVVDLSGLLPTGSARG